MSPESSKQKAAELIYQAHHTKKACKPIRTLFSKNDWRTAYEIQRINTNIWVNQGRRIAGYKIGLTSQVVQQQLGVNQPDFGVLFADMAVCDGEDIDYSRTLQPKVEAEIAIILGKDLNLAQPMVTDIIRATEFVLPAIEIEDSRICDWDISIVDTIADNASSGLFILGNTPRKLGNLELDLCGMVMTSREEPISTGVGKACLGHPLNAAVWLARTLSSQGMFFKAGDILLTGALGPAHDVTEGEVIEAKISGLGTVTAAFGSKGVAGNE